MKLPLAFILAVALVACGSIAPTVGGPTAETTTQTCPGGKICQQWESCPPLANPMGDCEAPVDAPPSQWEKKYPAKDAGFLKDSGL
jgi:hypothetical protein